MKSLSILKKLQVEKVGFKYFLAHSSFLSSTKSKEYFLSHLKSSQSAFGSKFLFSSQTSFSENI
ncbi:MAG: hypothetical protein LBQ24_05440 [Candidatus Peribacteria bacterium]|nr:hypothetical protein [Candidatus Peribacteria bacterium]